MPDIEVNDHGSIFILNPVTPEAGAWFEENVAQDGQRWGGGYVVEPRYVDDILDGAEAEGLTIG